MLNVRFEVSTAVTMMIIIWEMIIIKCLMFSSYSLGQSTFVFSFYYAHWVTNWLHSAFSQQWIGWGGRVVWLLHSRLISLGLCQETVDVAKVKNCESRSCCECIPQSEDAVTHLAFPSLCKRSRSLFWKEYNWSQEIRNHQHLLHLSENQGVFVLTFSFEVA
jgi:uncharacterized membrane protein YcjF (UPF0283 family)